MVHITLSLVPDFQGRTVAIEFTRPGPLFIKLTAAEYDQLAREMARIERDGTWSTGSLPSASRSPADGSTDGASADHPVCRYATRGRSCPP